MQTLQHQFARLVCKLSLAGLLAHCGNSSTTGSLVKSTNPPPQDRLLAIVMSGNKSCHRHHNNPYSPISASMYPDFKKFKEKMEATENMTIDFVLTCYDINGRLYLATSENPDEVTDADEDGVLPYIEKFRASRMGHRLLLIGHSYGGWLSLKTTLSLQSELESLPRLTLVTIDPISKITCSPFKPFGCSSSPTDITLPEYQTIGTSSNPWLNYYQRQTPIVRSSPIERATQNIEVHTSHMDIDNQPIVWSGVETAILGKI